MPKRHALQQRHQHLAHQHHRLHQHQIQRHLRRKKVSAVRSIFFLDEKLHLFKNSIINFDLLEPAEAKTPEINPISQEPVTPVPAVPPAPIVTGGVPTLDDPNHWSKDEKYDSEACLEAPYKKHLGRHANK